MTTIPDDIDLDADADGSAAGVDLKRISALAQRQMQLATEVASLEDNIKRTKADLDEVCRNLLPAAMDEAGMKRFTLSDGSEVMIKDICTANVPADGAIQKAKGDEREELIERRQRCLEWLGEHGGAPLIRNSVVADVGKGETELLAKLLDILDELNLTHTTKTAVHPGALAKFIREKMANMVEIPMDDFKVFIGQEAKITAGR